MSGPIVPPLEVTEVDGSPDGRPITKIVVSNGDLTVSGRTATIDTSGSAATPAGSDTEIQFNDGGAFGASSQFTYTTAASLGRIGMTTGNSATLAEIRALDGHGLKLASSDVAASAIRSYIDLFGENDAPSGVLVSSKEDGGIIYLKHTGTGFTEIANHTTDSDTTLNVYGNGAGTPILNLKNDTKEVRLTCEDDDKLYVRGPTSGERFTFDVSSATGGITWPDGSEQTSAASGGGGIGIVYPPISNSQSTALIHWGHISAPFGTSNQTTQSFSTDSPVWIPIIARRTATFTDIAIYVTSGVGSTSYVDLGLYSDNSGQPGTLLGQATVDVDTSGTKSATLAAEAGQSLTSTAGTQFWLSMVRQSGVGTFTMQAGNKSDVPQWAWTSYATSYGILVQSGSDNTLPATAAFTTGYAWQILALGVDYE